MASTVAVSSDESAEVPRSIVPVVAPAPPLVVEKDPPINPAAGGADEGSKVVRSVVRRWKREDLLEKAGLLLRALAWVFSLVAVAVMASNKQGGWMDFDRYQEYRYLLSVAAIALVYSMLQLLRQAHRFTTGKDLAPLTFSWTIDFAGDQIYVIPEDGARFFVINIMAAGGSKWSLLTCNLLPPLGFIMAD